jgi:putative PIN family toxin of toxin-antitoxin system
MRLVLDTNIIVSGTLWNGSPHLLLDAAYAKRFTACTCGEILAELHNVLRRPKFSAHLAQANTNPLLIVSGYRHLALQVSLPSLIPRVSRDPKDDVVLACAIQCHADAIVSGDKDLLSLGQYQNIPIVTSIQALLNLP